MSSSSNGKPKQTDDGRRFIAGDPIRALAALAVLFLHCGWAAQVQNYKPHGVFQGWAPSLLRIIEAGTIGPYLFFVLSGYLLGRPFVVAFVDGSQTPLVKDYLHNRALRIVPGFLVLIAVMLMLFETEGTAGLRLLAVPLFAQTYFPSRFAHSMDHAWTIDVDVAFYLLLPVGIWLVGNCAKGLSRPNRIRVILAGCAAVAVASTWLAGTPSVHDLDRQHWFPMYAGAFMPGIALAALSCVVPGRLAGRAAGRMLARALFALGLASFASYVLAVSSGVFWLSAALGTVASGLFVGAALVWQWTNASCWRLLDNRALRWLGRRSYSLYLFHLVILEELVLHFNQGAGLAGCLRYIALALVIMVPVSALGYALVERPFLSRRRQWRLAEEHLAVGTEGAELATLTAPTT
jgi:peptidoglycan/LPS O-acetylase OafA/YrhL